MEGCILCLGNPLLDVSAVVDAAFLEKYDVSERGRVGRSWPCHALSSSHQMSTAPTQCHVLPPSVMCPLPQLKPANQILAEEQHLKIYEVSPPFSLRGSSEWVLAGGAKWADKSD